VDEENPELSDDSMYLAIPQAHYRQGFPGRVTRWSRLTLISSTIAIACLSISAVIDVSTPNFDGFEPGKAARSLADGVTMSYSTSFHG